MLRNTNRALLAENKVLVEANAALRYGAKSAEWELNTLRENNHLLQMERDACQREIKTLRAAITDANDEHHEIINSLKYQLSKSRAELDSACAVFTEYPPPRR
jgi:chromosome segregation ATPase